MPYIQSFDTFAQEPDLYAETDLAFASTDWNSQSVNHATLYPTEYDGVDFTVSNMGYGVASTFASLLDSGSNKPQNLLAPSTVASSENTHGEIVPKHVENRSVSNTIFRRALACLSCVSDPLLHHYISVKSCHVAGRRVPESWRVFSH